MKTQEQVFTSKTVPVDVWRTLASREDLWAELHAHAAEYAAADGKVLTSTPSARDILYRRIVDGADGMPMDVECTREQAEFVRLRLTCWTEAR